MDLDIAIFIIGLVVQGAGVYCAFSNRLAKVEAKLAATTSECERHRGHHAKHFKASEDVAGLLAVLSARADAVEKQLSDLVRRFEHHEATQHG